MRELNSVQRFPQLSRALRHKREVTHGLSGPAPGSHTVPNAHPARALTCTIRRHPANDSTRENFAARIMRADGKMTTEKQILELISVCRTISDWCFL